MEPGEKVLSEVHLYHTSEVLSTSISNSVTRFELKLPSSDNIQTANNGEQETLNVVTTEPTDTRTTEEPCPSAHLGVGQDGEPCPSAHLGVDEDGEPCPSAHLEVDEDGDLILPRCRSNEDKAVITLEHRLATELKDVGGQVWAGALLLCDYLLHHKADFCGKTVVDLGAGTGLTTIVAAMMAKTVYCTDVGESVLNIALHNIDLNADLTSDCTVMVRELDWCQDCLIPGKGKFGLSETDLTNVLQADVIIAADVIYDDDLTDALLRTIHLLMGQGSAKTLYMGLEKRLVFTLADLDIACPAYTHFFEGLVQLQQRCRDGRQLLYSQVDEDLPMYLNYTRTKELEIWKIQSVIPNG